MAKEKKVVSVEMTEDQKDRVVEILAKEEEKKVSETQMIEINLRFQHRRNGNTYGPGRVRVAEDMGYSMLSADEKALESRIKENEGGERLVHIIGQGQSKVTKVVRDGIL